MVGMGVALLVVQELAQVECPVCLGTAERPWVGTRWACHMRKPPSNNAGSRKRLHFVTRGFMRA